mmetsp:Transcript_38017/g.94488  ORF Transcript_38017/g.94488 Transcript_38017/m.94488 type:complete len:325 (-) Transcript_38017:2357-3331(-)
MRPPPFITTRNTSSPLAHRLPCMSYDVMTNVDSNPACPCASPGPSTWQCAADVRSGCTSSWNGCPLMTHRPSFTVPTYSPACVQQYCAVYSPPSRGPSAGPTNPSTNCGPRSSTRKASPGVCSPMRRDRISKSACSPAVAVSSPGPCSTNSSDAVRSSISSVSLCPQKPTLNSPDGTTVTSKGESRMSAPFMVMRMRMRKKLLRSDTMRTRYDPFFRSLMSISTDAKSSRVPAVPSNATAMSSIPCRQSRPASSRTCTRNSHGSIAVTSGANPTTEVRDASERSGVTLCANGDPTTCSPHSITDTMYTVQPWNSGSSPAVKAHV